MTLTAISRYYCVLKPDLYRHLFAFRRTICYNFVVWIFAISEVLVVLFFGRARIVFNPYSVTCILTFQSQNSTAGYTLYVVFFYVVFCLSII